MGTGLAKWQEICDYLLLQYHILSSQQQTIGLDETCEGGQHEPLIHSCADGSGHLLKTLCDQDGKRNIHGFSIIIIGAEVQPE
jgi:hypothetical protein